MSIAGCSLGRFQFDLTRDVGASPKFSVVLPRQNQLRPIFIANSLKSALRSVSFISVGVGAKPQPFLKTSVSVSVKTFVRRSNTDLEQT